MYYICVYRVFIMQVEHYLSFETIGKSMVYIYFWISIACMHCVKDEMLWLQEVEISLGSLIIETLSLPMDFINITMHVSSADRRARLGYTASLLKYLIQIFSQAHIGIPAKQHCKPCCLVLGRNYLLLSVDGSYFWEGPSIHFLLAIISWIWNCRPCSHSAWKDITELEKRTLT